MDVLSQVLNPDAYLDAFDTKRHEIDEMPAGLLIARLTVALREDELITAEEVLIRLRKMSLVGYESFQLATASMWVAARLGDAAAFDRSLNTWLYGRRKFPTNWNSDVLLAPEFAPFLATVDPERLIPPPPPKPKAITKAERSFVADLVECRLCAVEDNLQWLREMGITNPASSLAKRYRLIAVNIGLGEATFRSKDDNLPDLIAALDNDGNYTSSFIAH
jgi:hypothetical protein